MGSVPVVELFVLAQGVPEMAFVPEQTAVEKLAAAGLHPPFHDRVHPRHPDTGKHSPDAGLGQDLIHERRELPIPVTDQKAGPATGVFQIHHQIPDGLGNPVPGRVCGGAEYAHASGDVFDDGQDVLTLPIKGDGLDKVAGQQGLGLGAQEVGPGGGRPLGCRNDALLFEDLSDR
ncbi:hypothetical protein Aph01nite_29150 [Acrocarpospora phusangensis]|uniref:Uncharacterized protein n=1 Tax=Acrocarpospora phusangensis TaxID=1070424 RepID=A0A919UQI7_9ACTN|nr:hypothetical protein [Acrocarpospora phusangensis]GIH24605.1 hypothetical protein Aph01nite_29150 [Acrocarpospora phusangensis]